MSEYVNPEMLAETAWLAEHVDDPGVRLVECDEEIDLYDRATSRAG